MSPDSAMELIADYASSYIITNEDVYDTARLCLADALGCAILSLQFPACTKLLGPAVAGTQVPQGARVPGTAFILDPIRAAFNISTMIRWLDYNDTWLAAEWGHPSDNSGGILALADFLNRQGKAHFTVRDVLTAIIKAYEIQGSIALLNSFNQLGFDHVILVKIATTAIATTLLGGNREQIMDAVSQAWIDAGPLRTYRHAPNTGSRKSWAAGDQCSRGIQFALMTMQGEMGYPQALTAKQWGFYDVLLKGNPLIFQRPLGTYVIENILFKVSYPAEFHAQTAVEAAILLHPQVKDRLKEIALIEIQTQDAALRIIDKTGPLHNPADRDHCLQYMVAVALIKGDLNAQDYSEEAATNPMIDFLRQKMRVIENTQYSKDYHDPEKRSIANAITITFTDGSRTLPSVVEYPLGHRRRRAESLTLILQKFKSNLATHYSPEKTAFLTALFQNSQELDRMPIDTFMTLLCKE